MDALEDFVIPAPYTLIDEDEDAIKRASPKKPKSSDWENDSLKDFKLRVRAYLRPLQNARCAYCRRKITESQATAEVEHIVHKGRRPDWMYKPQNYCLSCKKCNIKKSTKSVLKDMKVTNLPLNSDAYLLINPYYDKYFEHIELIDDILYKGISDKGKETIRICELNRYDLAAERAEDIIKSDANNYVKLMMLFLDKNRQTLLDNWEEFIERVKLFDPIMRYKANHAM